MKTVPISFNDDEPKEVMRDGSIMKGPVLESASPSKSAIKEVDAEKVKTSLGRLTGTISEILEDTRAVGNFKLKTVQLAVKISAEGGVSLIANAKTGMSGTISLTFEEQ